MQNVFNNEEFNNFLNYSYEKSASRLEIIKIVPNYLNQYFKNLYKIKILPIITLSNCLENQDNKAIKLKLINTESLISEKPIKIIIKQNKTKPINLSLEILNNISSYI